MSLVRVTASVWRLTVLGVLARALARGALRWHGVGKRGGFPSLADRLEPARTGYGVGALVPAVVIVSTGADADLARVVSGVRGWPSCGQGEQAGHNEERGLEMHLV